MIGVFRIIADKKPMFCCECPLNTTAVKIEKAECGKIDTVLDGDPGWKVGGKVPDNRCLITTIEEMENNKNTAKRHIALKTDSGYTYHCPICGNRFTGYPIKGKCKKCEQYVCFSDEEIGELYSE